MDEWKHLSYASSLCGNCTEVCAVKINLHELLLENRHESVEEGHTSFRKDGLEDVETSRSLNRSMMNMGNGKSKIKW